MSRYLLIKSLAVSLALSVFASVLILTGMDVQALSPTINQTAVRPGVSDVTKISERWAKEWGAKNLEGVLALYAEDAVFLPSTGSRVTGRAAIRQLFAGALASHSSKLTVHSKVTEHSGDLAYDSGEYEETSTAGGVTKSGRGQYLVILRREKDQWRIVQHMWTDLPVGQ